MKLLSLTCLSVVLVSCSTEDMNYFWNGPAGGSSSSSAADYADWHRTTERARYQQDAQAYQSGYRESAPLRSNYRY